MAITIGSLDLNAFNDLYSDSNQYFWFESSSSATYGAGVHITLSPKTSFIANPSGQNILVNTDGISLRNGLLPMMTLDNDSLDFNMIDTTSGTYTNIATFGLQTRIGRNETGYSRILIDPSSDNVDLINAFEILTPDDISAFSQKIDTTRDATLNGVQYYSSEDYPLVGGINVTGTPTTRSTIMSVDEIGRIRNGASIHITFLTITTFSGAGMVYVVLPVVQDIMSFDIVKGVPSTMTITSNQCVGQEVDEGVTSQGFTNTMQITYDGNQQLNITSTLQRITNDGSYWVDEIYLFKTAYEFHSPYLPLLAQTGDIILGEDQLGVTFVELEVDANANADTDATSGNDMELFNSIRSLGWYGDVIGGVTLSPSSATIGYGYTETVQLTAKAIPENLEVTWKNLSPEVLTLTDDGLVGYISFGGTLGYIQASVVLAGKTYYAVSAITVVQTG